MPSVSKAQARFVRAKAAEGEGWAKEWAAAEGPTNLLPERVGHRKGKRKSSFKKKAGVR